MKVKYRAKKKTKNLEKCIVIQTQTVQKMALLSRRRAVTYKQSIKNEYVTNL